MKKKFHKIAVLLGGPSAERAVSLVSGEAVCDALETLGYDIKKFDPINIDEASLARLKKDIILYAPDACFNALHGQFGEDGGVQKILEELKIPYSHSGVATSCLAMNKTAALTHLAKYGVPIAPHITKTTQQIKKLSHENLPMDVPFVIKPVFEGSSVGLYIVKHKQHFPDLTSWHFGDAMIEEYIPGLELTTAVLDINGTPSVLAVTELQPKRGVYDYKAKYQDGETIHICPAKIDKKITEQCLSFADAAHRAIGAVGLSRSDFRYDPKHDRLVLLEINTQPGMTNLSLVPEQAKYRGIEFPELVDIILASACLKEK
ncbi:MAG: D-alanine--D-alanine ligase [Alphaproteobacteria bacterium]